MRLHILPAIPARPRGVFASCGRIAGTAGQIAAVASGGDEYGRTGTGRGTRRTWFQRPCIIADQMKALGWHGRASAIFLLASLGVLPAPAARADKKEVPFFQKPSLMPERNAEKRAAELATPHVLRPPPPIAGAPVRKVRVRVYGDLDYRAVTPRWQARLRTLIERVNGFVEGGFSVHLELQAVHGWERRSSGTPIEDSLAALRALDAGNDVDWVIGLVSPLAGVTNDLHALGMATVLGKHFVLRSADDPAEAASIDQNLHRLTDDERQSLYVSRKEHREIIIFLHEWAHTLGALHDLDPSRIMNGTYSLNQVGISDDNVQIMRLALDGLVGPSFDLRPLVAFVEGRTLDDARAQDRDRLLRLLHDRGSRAGAPAAPPTRTGASTAPAAAPPAAPASEPAQALAEAVRKLLADGHREEARERVESAKRRALSGAKEPAGLVAVAAGYRELGAVTLTEEALALAGDAAGTKSLSTWTATARAHVGLPKDAGAFKVAVDDEPAYLALFGRIEERLRASDKVGAATLVRDGLARYPGAPGLLALRCDLELRAAQPKIARRTCTAALEADDGAARAHKLIASMDLDAGNRDGARAHLLRALTLDPDDPEAARMLVRLHH